jgi:hypothetical protein
MYTVYYNNVKHEIASYGEIKIAELHRDNDLPALFWSDIKDQVESWFQHGKRHREGDLPSITSIASATEGSIWSDGLKYWYKNGKQHRDGNLPAVIWDDTHHSWYKNDKCYYRFDLRKMIYIQTCLKLFFHFKRNKFLWSPNNLGGKFTKNQILLLFKN